MARRIHRIRDPVSQLVQPIGAFQVGKLDVDVLGPARMCRRGIGGIGVDVDRDDAAGIAHRCKGEYRFAVNAHAGTVAHPDRRRIGTLTEAGVGVFRKDDGVRLLRRSTSQIP